MSVFDTTAIHTTREADAYPSLDALLGGYFHQDFDINGSTLPEILGVYRQDATESERQGVISDVHRLISAYGQTDKALAEAFQRIFKPDVTIEGWEGLTSRQWLQETSRLLA